MLGPGLVQAIIQVIDLLANLEQHFFHVLAVVHVLQLVLVLR